MIKYSSLVRGFSKISGALIKISLVIIAANLIAFASIYILEAFLAATLFILFFIKKSDFSVATWKFSFKRAKSLLGEGWMLMLGAIFAMIYLKIDQVMIKWMIDTEEVGIYSVAVKLSETWYFIPTAIVSSLFPKLLELKKESEEKLNERLQYLFNLLFLVAFGLAIVITFISEPVINFLYGQEFQGSAIILTIHIWAGVFIFMRAAFSKWILVEDAIVFSLITQGLGALANIIINFVLIPKYGGVGAATATIISYAMASYFALLFYKKSRPIFWMMTKAIFSPLLMLKKIR
jgi:O-antigen/teichoic acid export membrane protein